MLDDGYILRRLWYWIRSTQKEKPMNSVLRSILKYLDIQFWSDMKDMKVNPRMVQYDRKKFESNLAVGIRSGGRHVIPTQSNSYLSTGYGTGIFFSTVTGTGIDGPRM